MTHTTQSQVIGKRRKRESATVIIVLVFYPSLLFSYLEKLPSYYRQVGQRNLLRIQVRLSFAVCVSVCVCVIRFPSIYSARVCVCVCMCFASGVRPSDAFFRYASGISLFSFVSRPAWVCNRHARRIPIYLPMYVIWWTLSVSWEIVSFNSVRPINSAVQIQTCSPIDSKGNFLWSILKSFYISPAEK